MQPIDKYATLDGYEQHIRDTYYDPTEATNNRYWSRKISVEYCQR